MNRLILLLALSSTVQAAWYDQNGNKIPDGAETSNNVYWPAVLETDTKYTGVGHYSFCSPSTLIKTWTGDTPPVGAKAYAVHHPRCWSSPMDAFDASRILGNLTISPTAPFTQMYWNTTKYVQDAGIDISLYNTTVSRIVFSTFNTTTLAVAEFVETAQELLDRGYKFYNIANSFPVVGETITGISFYNALDSQNFGYKRYSVGKYMGGQPSAKSDTGYVKSYFVFKTTLNYFTDGSPIFDKDMNLLGMSFLLDEDYNFGNHVLELAHCFDSNATWSFNQPLCLRGWKQLFKEFWGYQLPGWTAPCLNGRCLETVADNRNTQTLGSTVNSDWASKIAGL